MENASRPLLRTQVRVRKGGKRKYWRRKYEFAGLENECRKHKYIPQIHVNTVCGDYNGSCMPTWYRGNFDKADITKSCHNSGWSCCNLYCYWRRLLSVYCHQHSRPTIHTHQLNFGIVVFIQWMCDIITTVTSSVTVQLWNCTAVRTISTQLVIISYTVAQCRH